MTTALDKPLRREARIGDALCTLTIDPSGLKLVQKGRRNGLALVGEDLVNGDAAFSPALHVRSRQGRP